MTRTHINTLVESDYLGQWDLIDPNSGKTREVTVEIEGVRKYQPEVRKKKRMPDGSYKLEPNKRIEIRFKGKRKSWLAGAVSRKTIRAMYGNYLEDWIGKKLTLYVDFDVMFGSEKTGGLRVRPMVPKGEATADPLDNPVDAAKAEQIERASGREPGEEG